MTALDVYWSFRSPYSYLAIDRLVAVKRDYDVDFAFRPVRPLAMRETDFFEKGRKQFLPYLFQDAPREAERLGIPFELPDPDPVAMDMASGKVDQHQPIMDKIMALAVAAQEEGRAVELAQRVSRAVWGGVKNWHSNENLALIVKDAGLDLESLSRWASANSKKIHEVIAANEKAQLAHHWGVPLMVLDGEAFFGQDRLDSLVWRLDQCGCKRS